MANRDRYYIRRQTNAGRNQGRWCVHSPDGVTLVGGLDKGTAAHVCAAFEIARQHPTEGETIRFRQNYMAGMEERWSGGKHYVYRKGGNTIGGMG